MVESKRAETFEIDLGEESRRDKARIDGDWLAGRSYSPEYVRAYWLATRTLFDGSRQQRPDMAMPVAYMQRHFVELALKLLYELATDIHNWSELAAHDAAPRNTTKTGHDLNELARATRAAILKLGVASFYEPKALLTLAVEVGKQEAGDETCWRYAAKKKSGQSFSEPVQLPISRWQAEIDTIYERDFGFDASGIYEPESTSLASQLIWELYGIQESLYQAQY